MPQVVSRTGGPPLVGVARVWGRRGILPRIPNVFGMWSASSCLRGKVTYIADKFKYPWDKDGHSSRTIIIQISVTSVNGDTCPG